MLWMTLQSPTFPLFKNEQTTAKMPRLPWRLDSHPECYLEEMRGLVKYSFYG